MSDWHETMVERDDEEIDILVEYDFYKGSPARISYDPLRSDPGEPCEIDINQVKPDIKLSFNEEERIKDEITERMAVRILTDEIDRADYYYRCRLEE